MKLRIETLRGLACFLLVFYHAVGADQRYGLKVGDGLIRWLNDGLVYLRMPLFIFLSGLVYGLRPFNGDTRSFLAGKARRLLIPMLVVGTLFALMQTMTPGVNSSAGTWYLWHVEPVAHYWFVESAFLVFVVIWMLERGNLISSGKGFAITLLLTCALYLTVRGWHWLGIQGAIYLLPYFLVGLACARFSLEKRLLDPWTKLGLVVLAVGAIVTLGMPIPEPDRRTLGMLVAGISLCLLCFSTGIVIPRLARLGGYSYTIYLFHVFFTAAARIGLDLLHIKHLGIQLVLGVILGLAGPVVLQRSLSRFQWLTLLLMGRAVKVNQRAMPGPGRLSPAG